MWCSSPTAAAVDATVPTGERADAIRPLIVLNETHPVNELRDVALGAVRDDPDDRLRGTALLVSWPHAVTTAEVFDSLPIPQRQNLIGPYSEFLRIFEEGLTAADLPAALVWLDATDVGRDHRIAGVANTIIRLALDNLDDPSCLDALVRLAHQRIKDYRGLLYEDHRAGADPLDDDLVRRTLGAAFIASAPADDAVYFASDISPHGLGLFREPDMGWVCERYRDHPAERPQLGRIASNLFWTASDEGRELYYDLDPAHPLHQDLIAGFIAPCPLVGEEADRGREQVERMRAHQAGVDEERAADRSTEEIGELLDAFDAGDMAAYARVFWLLGSRPGTTLVQDTPVGDVTTVARWQILDETIQQRMIDGAPTYLAQADLAPVDWYTLRGQIVFVIDAAFKAFVLLHHRNPAALDDLSPEVWRKWAPVLVLHETHGDDGGRAEKVALLERAVVHARDELIQAIIDRFAHGAPIGEYVYIQREVDLLWDDRIAEAFATLLDDDTLADTPRHQMVEYLVAHDLDRARPRLRRWFDERDDEGKLTGRALEGGVLLFRHDPTSWPAIRDVLADEATAEPLIERVVSHFDRPVPPYTADEFADLFLWLLDRYPAHEDPEGSDVVGPVRFREQIGFWRDALLANLRDLGTEESAAAVSRIVAAVPHQRWLRRSEAAAHQALRRARWEPLVPATIARLGADSAAVVVRTADQLLDQVCEQLLGLQQRLHGEAAESQFLWNTNTVTPKSEDEMSDWTMLRLRDQMRDGSIVNREVQVRRHRASGIGERTDIRIDATSPGSADALTVVIEAKLAWNRDIATVVRSQLVEQYLEPIGSCHGIVLVFWCEPHDEWPEADRAGKRVANLDRGAIEAQLRAQAHEMAADGYRIEVVVLDVTWPASKAGPAGQLTAESATAEAAQQGTS